MNEFVMEIVEPTEAAVRDSNNIYHFSYSIKLEVPMPAANGFGGVQKVAVDGGLNANGDFEGAVLGEPKRKIDQFSWNGIDTAKGREILQYFDDKSHFTFYARYFDLIRGEWVIRKFYRGDLSFEPHVFDSVKGDIDYWNSIKISVAEV
jgi:hypothetical protein